MTGTVRNVNLKPCPLCREKVDLIYDNQEGYWIECDCGIIFYSSDGYDKETTINEWNNRIED